MPPMASQEARTAAVKAVVYSAGEFCASKKVSEEEKPAEDFVDAHGRGEPDPFVHRGLV